MADKQVFGWFPDMGSDMNCEPSVQQTKFGDGYESRTPQGINYMPEKWSLTFHRRDAVVLEVRAFLKAHGATQSFLWTTPFQEEGTFICRSWKVARNKGTLSLTCTFEQVYEY